MPPSLPPYLISGASSRSHHALLVKYHEAESDQAGDEILRKEVVRQKELMSLKGQSTSRISESLIVLLHIAMIRHDTGADLDFALVPALHLAESGRTIQEKRIGYLYLQESMAPGHELALMLINSIRKAGSSPTSTDKQDLSSSSHSHVLLALHTIVKLPSRDLSPAVTPLLTSKGLLKHKSPAIRQRTIQAICALHMDTSDGNFPLSMSKLVRMLAAEEDESVTSVIVGTLKRVLELGIRSIGGREEALFLCEHMINIATERLEQGGPLLLHCITMLRQIVSSPHGRDCGPQVSDFLLVALPLQDVNDPARGAVLLEICHLLGIYDVPSKIAVSLISRLGHGLRPSRTASSTSQIPYTPRPNTHVLVIRCFHLLPVRLWDAKLGEAEMGVLMGGLNSPDVTIRRYTLRLVQRLSPELLNTSLANHLQALRTSSNLSLPLKVPADLGEKTVAGRLETSGRALEVVDIMYCDHSSTADALDRGSYCARAFIEIVAALNEGVLNSTETGSTNRLNSKGQVWEDGLRGMLTILESSSKDFEMGFTAAIIESRIGSATLAVLRGTLLSRTPLDPSTADKAVQVLLEDLADFGPSVQEIVLVALVVVLSQMEADQESVIGVIRQVQLEAGKYIKKRCGQIVDLIQQGLLGQVMTETESRSIPDVLEAIMVVHRQWIKSQQRNVKLSPDSPTSPTRSTTSGPASLRYESYDPSSSSPSLLSIGGSTRAPFRSDASKARTKTPRAELALFDADDEDGRLDAGRHGADSANAKLGLLSIADPSSDGLDPFTGDEARTPTMRESRHVGI